jgi:hypothetical protein
MLASVIAAPRSPSSPAVRGRFPCTVGWLGFGKDVHKLRRAIVRLIEEIMPQTEYRAIRLFNEPIEQDDLVVKYAVPNASGPPTRSPVCRPRPRGR